MKTRIQIISILFFSSFGLFTACVKEDPAAELAANGAFEPQPDALQQYFLSSRIVTIDGKEVYEKVKGLKAGEAKSIALAKSGEEKWELSLRRNEVMEESFVPDVSMNKSGESLDLLTLEGFLGFRMEDEARLTVSTEYLSGFVMENGEKFFVEPLFLYIPGGPENQYVIYAESAVIDDGSVCGVSTPEMNKAEEPGLPIKELPTASALCRKIDVRASCDYPYFQAAGYKVSTAVFLMASALNNADAMYTSLGIDLVTTSSSFQVRTSPDALSTDAVTMLNQVAAMGNTTPAYLRDVWVFFTRRNIASNGNTSTIGIAYVGVVCRNPNYSYAVVETSVSSYIPKTIAHEIGHALGAAHNSTCPGGIMYPSVNGTCAGNTFVYPSTTQIRNHVNAYGTCMGTGTCN